MVIAVVSGVLGSVCHKLSWDLRNGACAVKYPLIHPHSVVSSWVKCRVSKQRHAHKVASFSSTLPNDCRSVSFVWK